MNADDLKGFIAKEWRAFIADAVRPIAPQVDDPAKREGQLIERASEGAAARGFLDNALFVDFMAKAEANLTHALLGLPLDDDAGRRNLAVAIQTQRQWMKYLAALAGDGRAAERELERLRSGRRDFF